MERYLDFIINIAAGANGADLQPVYSVTGKAGASTSARSPSLPGYRGMGPVRIGNQAYRAGPARRLRRGGARGRARILRRAARAAQRPGAVPAARAARRARGRALRRSPTPAPGSCAATRHVHTFSSVMCWAACDRLAKIAARIGLEERAAPLARARRRDARRDLRARLEREALELRRHLRRRASGREPAAAARAWFPRAPTIRASPARCAPWSGSCRRGDFVFRYSEPDDFGVPDNAFAVCTFWYVDALAALGRARGSARAVREPARALQPARPAVRAHRAGDAASCGATSRRPTAWSA